MNIYHAWLIREMDEEALAMFQDALDAPITRMEIEQDAEWIAELNEPLRASFEELDERQRAFLESRGITGDG